MRAVNEFPRPTLPVDDPREVLIGYLDFYREVMCTKVRGMSRLDQSRSILPSGWTPLELLHHLRHVERRWLEWGFSGAAIPDPWADERDGRWHTDDDVALLVAALDRQAEVTRRVIREHDLSDVGQPGERWDGEPPPSLSRVLLHLLQEYARHCGQLDIVRELIDGQTGETGD